MISRGYFADQILAQTHQPVRIGNYRSPADINIVMDPQPFPRDNQVDDPVLSAIKRDRLRPETRLPENLLNARFASRDLTAIDISRLVTSLVTRNGTWDTPNSPFE
jgi:hypothetical protein